MFKNDGRRNGGKTTGPEIIMINVEDLRQHVGKFIAIKSCSYLRLIFVESYDDIIILYSPIDNIGKVNIWNFAKQLSSYTKYVEVSKNITNINYHFLQTIFEENNETN